jgi:hypothetical protein
MRDDTAVGSQEIFMVSKASLRSGLGSLRFKGKFGSIYRTCGQNESLGLLRWSKILTSVYHFGKSLSSRLGGLYAATTYLLRICTKEASGTPKVELQEKLFVC